MTPLRDRPEVAAFAAAIRAGDDTAPAAFCDWLDEAGAAAADVCVLFAGPPPTLAPCSRCDGTGNGWLLVDGPSGREEWEPRCPDCCGTGIRSAPDMPPADDPCLQGVLAEWAARHGPPGRAADVRGLACERGAWGAAWWVGASRTRGGNLAGVPYDSEPAARRALKRAVLALWSEVRVPCPGVCGGDPMPPESPLRCARCHGSGTVAPAGLIPPGPGVLFHPDPSPE